MSLGYLEEFTYSLRFDLKTNLKKKLNAATYYLLFTQTTPLILAADV